jgi:hypothetical protein
VPKHRYAAGLFIPKPAISFVLTQGGKILRLRLVGVKAPFSKKRDRLAILVGMACFTIIASEQKERERDVVPLSGS